MQIHPIITKYRSRWISQDERIAGILEFLKTQKFGQLRVDSFSHTRNGNTFVWLCICDCGGETRTATSKLLTGHSTSCGCYRSVAGSLARRTHGLSHKIPEYGVWKRMLQRVRDPNIEEFCRYGGRGIDVCERWLKFELFLADMGLRPGRNYSIERSDVNGNYCPENCCWATKKEQGRNKRNNRMLMHRGETMCVSAWAERRGLPWYTIYGRLNAGWSVEDAIETPVERKKSSDQTNYGSGGIRFPERTKNGPIPARRRDRIHGRQKACS